MRYSLCTIIHWPEDTVMKFDIHSIVGKFNNHYLKAVYKGVGAEGLFPKVIGEHGQKLWNLYKETSEEQEKAQASNGQPYIVLQHQDKTNVKVYKKDRVRNNSFPAVYSEEFPFPTYNAQA